MNSCKRLQEFFCLAHMLAVSFDLKVLHQSNIHHAHMDYRSRIKEIDALRGLALFGILWVNIFVFHAPYSHYGAFYGAFEGLDGQLVNFVVDFVSGKFLFIFAFLFGMGVSIQELVRKTNFLSYHYRRMVVLALFGAIHILGFWFGDILLTYALLGLLLTSFIRLSNRWIATIAFFFFFFRALYYLGTIWWHWPMVGAEAPAADLEHFKSVFGHGSFAEIFQLRMLELKSFMPENLVWYIPKTLGVILLGYLSVRLNMITFIKDFPLKILLIVLALLGLGIAWMLLRGTVFSQFDLEATPLARPFLISLNVMAETYLGIAYILGFLLLFKALPKISMLFQSLGKMALSNYIFQSLVCVLIFYGFGAGLYMDLKPTQLTWLTLVIFATQGFLSYLWLKYFKRGPLEELWRTMTNLRKVRSQTGDHDI